MSRYILAGRAGAVRDLETHHRSLSRRAEPTILQYDAVYHDTP